MTLPPSSTVRLKPRLSVLGSYGFRPRPPPPPSRKMAPHMSNAELDRATALHAAGKTPVEVHALLQRPRAARGQSGPDLTTVRRGPGGGGLGPGRLLAETFPVRGAPRPCPELLAGLAASARPALSLGRFYFLHSCR